MDYDTVFGNTEDLPVSIDEINNGTDTNYEFFIVHDDDCQTTSSIEEFTTLIDGISELELIKEATIYPNPANDFITLSIKNNQIIEGTLEIYSIEGKRLFSVDDYTTNTAFYIDLKPGIYTVKFIHDNDLYINNAILN